MEKLIILITVYITLFLFYEKYQKNFKKGINELSLIFDDRKKVLKSKRKYKKRNFLIKLLFIFTSFLLFYMIFL